MTDQPPQTAIVEAPELTAYQLNPYEAPPLVPAEPARDWMSDTSERFAYRCLPLSIANSSGWELRSPCSFRAKWNGGKLAGDVTVTPLDDDATLVGRTALGHFGHGVLTFHTGYLFRTSKGWGLWARGAPNSAKHGIAPLDGLIETDWLPFGFTMNWLFTAPGEVEFKKGEVFCFITPVPHHMLDHMQPTIRMIDSNPQLKSDYENWAQSRGQFIDKLRANDPATVAQGWQRHYIQGKDSAGNVATQMHVSKRRLADFKKFRACVQWLLVFF